MDTNMICKAFNKTFKNTGRHHVRTYLSRNKRFDPRYKNYKLIIDSLFYGYNYNNELLLNLYNDEDINNIIKLISDYKEILVCEAVGFNKLNDFLKRLNN